MEQTLDNYQLQLTNEQLLAARLEAASHQSGAITSGNSRVWSFPEQHSELVVRVDSDNQTYDDIVYSAKVYLDPDKPEAGYYEAISSPEGTRIMQPGGGHQEVVTDPERRQALIGGFATKLQTAIEAAERPKAPSPVVSLLGRLAHRSNQLSEAA